MKFSFIGDFSLDLSKERAVSTGTTKSGDPYMTIRPSIIAEKNNRGFVESFAMKSNIIKTYTTEGEAVDVRWEDRFDPDVLKSVASYRKYTVALENERKEFISKYDFNEYVLSSIEQLNGKRVLVTGMTKKDFYQGKSRDTFPIDNIYVLKEDDDRKNILSMTGVIYWNKEGIDTADFKENKKIYVNAYTQEYISKDEGRKFVAQQFVLDCSKVDWNNENHVAQTRARLIQLGLDYEDGKIVNKLKKNYVMNEFEFRVQNGAEEVEFTIEQCTETQKMFISLGMKKLEDFRPRGNIYGERVVEYKIKTPTLLGDFNDGKLDYDGKPSEFEDNIYVPLQDEKIEEVLPFEEDMNPPETDNVDVDNIF